MLHAKIPHSASSESLGFRPPQFSDDLAWLPEWLQPRVEGIASGDGREDKDCQNHVGSSIKEVSQSGDDRCQGEGPRCISAKDIRKEGLCLHLSGDDDSPLPATPFPEKVPIFTLHLSTEGSPGSGYFPTIETSPNTRLKSVVQSVEDLQETGDMNESHLESKHDNVMFSSACNQHKSAGSSSQTQCNLQDAKKQLPPTQNGISSKEHEISDAVELSTAASEALVIYKLIKSDPYSDALSTTNILEFAHKVKQTRLHWLNDVVIFSNSNGSTSSPDLLSDTDDSDMEDAYADVGLSVTGSPNICSKGTSISKVAETPISEHCFSEDGTGGSKNEENNIYGSEGEPQLELLQIDLAVDIADAENKNSVINNDILNLVPSISCGDNLMTHQLQRRISYEIKSQQEDASRGAKCRRINPFRGNFMETSYFSESADVAPDLHSRVCKHDESLKISSQSSIHLGVLCRTSINGSLLSHDIAKDSALSFVDPLCSVIPCSISSRTRDCLPTHNDEKHNADIMLTPEIDHEAETVLNTSCLKDEAVYREKQDKSAANSPDSCLNVRHAAALDVYSMQSPTLQDFLLQNDCNHVHAQQTESAIGGSVSCNRITATVDSLPKGSHQTAKNGAELQISLQNEEMTPRILGHRTRHRVQANKSLISSENEKQNIVNESSARFDPNGILQSPHIQHGSFPDTCIPARKRVRFNDDIVEYPNKRDSPKLTSNYRSSKKSLGKRSSTVKRMHSPDQQHCWSSQEVKAHLTNFDRKDKKKPIFQGVDFLLTGFPSKKEKEVERVLRKHGGAVLAGIPSPCKNRARRRKSESAQLPVVICTKKLQTRKFLYGCAVNAFLLKVDWVTDSIEAGSVLPPEKYLILPNQTNRWANRIMKPVHSRTDEHIFCKVGIMLHGEHGFFFKLAEVIKHGQGSVFKSLQGMVQSLKNKKISTGFIIADSESFATRHLRKCASEQGIPVMSTSWIINCIYNGKLLPFEENNAPPLSAPIEIQAVTASQEWTQEI